MNERISTWRGLDGPRIYQLSLRLGLFGMAVSLLFQTDTIRGAEDIGYLLPVVLSLLEYGLAFAVIVLALRQDLPAWTQWLIPAIGLLLVLNFLIFHDAEFHRIGVWSTDVHLYADYAARLFMRGVNPYTADMAGAYRALSAPTVLITPTAVDGVAAGLAYPALSFLILLPFHWLQLPSEYAYILFVVLCLAVLYVGSPRVVRPVVLLPFVANTYFISVSLFGLNDSIWTFFLMLTILTWRSQRWRAVHYGLACAAKGQPWLLAPFLLIRIWKEEDRQTRVRRVAEFFGVSGLVFIVTNLPFIVSNPDVWLKSILDVVGERKILIGLGIARLTELGFVQISSAFFTGFMIVVLAAALFLYWRHFRQWREAMWIVPALVFWVAYRSLPHYWLFFTLPVALALMRNPWSGAVVSQEAPASEQRRWPSVAVVAAGALIIVGAVVLQAVTPGSLSLSISGPVRASGDNVSSLDVVVTNAGSEPIWPRFSVRSRGTGQPTFWQIESGPDSVQPGESGRYTIAGRPGSGLFFNVREGAEIIVTDVRNADIRTAAFVPGDTTPVFPGVPPNGDFRFWRLDQQAPNYWALLSDPPDDTAIAPITWDADSYGLRFTLQYTGASVWTSVMLDTQILFPQAPLRVWVKPPQDANRLPELNLAYGLELSANDKRVWLLFGDADAKGQLEPDIYYRMLPAPREQWSEQTIDLRQIFADVGFEISDMKTEPVWRFDHFNMPKTSLALRLLLANRNVTMPPVVAEFGPISTTALVADADILVQDAIDHPERYLIWRGEANRLARNYELALEQFERAIAVAPDEAQAYLGLARTLLDVGDFTGAASRFERAQSLILEHAGRYDQTDLADSYTGAIEAAAKLGDCARVADLLEAARKQLPPDFDFPDAAPDCRRLLAGSGVAAG